MMKEKKRAGVILAAALATALACPPAAVFAETSRTEAQIREVQEAIVDWEMERNESDQLLTGELLDNADGRESQWFAFAASRIGIEDNQAQYLARLQQVVEYYYANLEAEKENLKATDWHRLALTIRACGGDPTAFGVDPEGNPINLIADGTYDCIMGDPGQQGINGYIWALIALDSGDYQEPDNASWGREELTAAILEEQQENGGFGLRSDETNVDITAMAVTALAPYQEDEAVQTAVNGALEYLSEAQNADGTMSTDGERTAESTGWTLTAVCSAGLDPETEERFVKEGGGLLDGILLFRQEDGGFIHSLDAEEEQESGAMAGYQTVYALESYRRFLADEPALFDLTDAETVSPEEIEAEKEKLPEYTGQPEDRNAEQIQQETEQRSSWILVLCVIIGAAVVTLLAVSVVHGKRKKARAEAQRQEEEDEDDDW